VALANAEALLNLATTLIRSSPGMLPTLCSGDDSWTSHRSHDANGWVPGLITRISHLQRLVHATAAALQDEGGLRKMEMEERQKKIKEYVAEWCKRTGGQEKDLEKDPNVDSKILMAKQAVEVLQLMQSLQSLSNHFVTSHNYFCSSLAKNTRCSREAPRASSRCRCAAPWRQSRGLNSKKPKTTGTSGARRGRSTTCTRFSSTPDVDAARVWCSITCASTTRGEQIPPPPTVRVST
jgi:hypothetical protein